MTLALRDLYKAIDALLWYNWDPIGVNTNTLLRDEYQAYTSAIFSLKVKGASSAAIAKELHRLETATMGLTGDATQCRQVADQIVNL